MKKKQTSAEKTAFLKERIKQNELNQTFNLNEWAFSKIEPSLDKLSILEYCCGTGKQTSSLKKAFPNSKITCLDISPEAIESIKNSTFYDHSINAIVSNMDDFSATNKNKFDIIFVSYGLYYAKNIDMVLEKSFSFLKNNGKFIVLGPYGRNNLNLFNLVKKSDVVIDKEIEYSCTDFMHDTVIKKALLVFQDISISTGINPVNWLKPEDIISYWENSTFYNSNKSDEFKKNLNLHFKNNSKFVNEKHIMLLQCKKDA